MSELVDESHLPGLQTVLQLVEDEDLEIPIDLYLDGGVIIGCLVSDETFQQDSLKSLQSVLPDDPSEAGRRRAEKVGEAFRQTVPRSSTAAAHVNVRVSYSVFSGRELVYAEGTVVRVPLRRVTGYGFARGGEPGLDEDEGLQ